MKKYVYIGIFGFFGAISRYAVKNVDLSALIRHFPLNTLLINLTGSLIFALVMTIALETGRLDRSLRLGLTAGFLGAYTTFSTFCKDTVLAVQDGRIAEAAAYVLLSIILGLAVTHGGIILAKSYVMKLLRKLKAVYPAAKNTGENTGENKD